MIDGIAAGTASYVMSVMAYDSASTIGAGLTGITYNGGITCYYKRSNGSASVACTINTISTLGTYAGSATNAAWKEIDSTNMKGLYELQIPNNAFATGATDVAITLQATGMVPITLYFRINPPADVQTVLGTAVTATTGGILDVNAKNINNSTAVNGLTAAAIATGVWTDTTAGDFTTSLSVGKSVMNGVSLGTGLKIAECVLADTLTTYTGNTVQTGDAFARLGVAGVGLTNLGDTRIANLDAAISTRTKPADTQAAVTTVTNLTNAPSNGDFTATMKTSLSAATPTVTVGTVSAGVINNAAFNADVGSTAFASNTIAAAVFKALDSAIGDAVSLTADGLLDKVRTMGWIMRNKVTVTDASGDTVIYKDNSITAAFTVATMLTDNSTTTTRLRAA